MDKQIGRNRHHDESAVVGEVISSPELGDLNSRHCRGSVIGDGAADG